MEESYNVEYAPPQWLSGHGTSHLTPRPNLCSAAVPCFHHSTSSLKNTTSDHQLFLSQVTLWVCGKAPFNAELGCTTDEDLPAKCQRRRLLICLGPTRPSPNSEGLRRGRPAAGRDRRRGPSRSVGADTAYIYGACLAHGSTTASHDHHNLIPPWPRIFLQVNWPSAVSSGLLPCFQYLHQ